MMKKLFSTNYSNANSRKETVYSNFSPRPRGYFQKWLTVLVFATSILLGVNSNGWGQVSLITASDGGFENATSTFAANGWTEAQATSGRAWRVGTYGSASTGTKAAYWGTATAYGGAATAVTKHFYRDIAIPAGASNVYLNFKLKYPTIDNTYDYVYVFTTTTANTPANGTVPSTGYTQRFVNTATTYSSFTAMSQVDLSDLAGTTVRLVFTFKCDAVAPNAGPAVDDITLTYICSTPTCPTLSAPLNAATGVSQTPTLSWTAGTNTNSYDVYLSTNQADVNSQLAGALVSANQAGTTYAPSTLSPSTTYYWRVVPKNGCGNSGSGCTTNSFTTTAPVPTISVGSLTAFGNQCVNTTSSAGSFTVSGINLTGNVSIAALSGYSYCLTAGGTYTSTLSIPASGTLASTTVYVKFAPTAASAYSGNIVVSSSGATSANVAASGTGVNTTISTQPSSSAATYCTSASATALTVAATATNGSAFAYQWYSNTTASTSGGTAVGTNSTSYTPVTTSNGTLYYYCVVSGCGTAATSNVSGAISTVTCINMPTTSGSTTLTGNTSFYDNGGPGGSATTDAVAGNYPNSQASVVYTIYPTSCSKLQAVFTEFGVETCCDNLKIYDGNSTSATLLGTYTASPGTITSTAADGSLTFVFYSDGSVTRLGFGANLTNVPLTTGPAAPTGFVGTLNPEVGSTQTYSVTNVSGNTYTWSFPSGWVINSGQGTNSVSVTVGGTNGTISCTPVQCSLNGTAYTTTTTIPNYRWAYVSSSLGAATWTGGESRNVDITIKNTGVGTWNSGVTTNAAIRWDSDNSNAAFSPWSDYHSRVTAGSVAPGAQATYTLSIEAKNATSGPTYGANLADGSYYLAFDLVNEGSCWFAGGAGGAGACTAGNSPWYSSVQTVSSVPTLSCTSLTAFGNVCVNNTAGPNSFTISGANLTANVSVASLSGYTYSTSSTGTYTSTLTLTPSSGVVNQAVYVKFTPTAVSSYSGNIGVSSTGATTVNVAASGSGIAVPTANAGSDFSMCSGQTVAISASTNATSSSGSASATYSSGNGNSTYLASPTISSSSTCFIPLSVSIPANAVITGVNVSYSFIAASGAYMSEQRSYLKCTNSGGISESSLSSGSGATGGTLAYSRNNLNIANNVSGGGTIDFQLHTFRTWQGAGDCNTTYNYINNNTFTVTVNYTINPTYSWSPSTGLSASNVLAPNCSATSSTTYNLTVTSTNGCTASDAVAVTVTGSAPSAPTTSVSGSSTINVGGTATLTSSAGANTLWYTAASGESSVGSGDNWQTPFQCTVGTKTYYAENNNGTCASATRTAVTFTVRSMVAENPSNGLICTSGGSVTLSAQLTGGSSISWSPSTNLSATSGASTIASPLATTVYTMSATVTGCGSVSESATVGVIDGVAITPTSTPSSVCAGGTALLASNLNTTNFSASCITASNSLRTPPVGAVTLISNNTLSTSLPSGVTASSSTNLDDNFWSGVPIGFTYNYFGENATNVFIGTNGTVVVGVPTAVGSSAYSFAGGFPNLANPAATIAVCARDLRWDQNASGTLKYWTEGIAPTRKFIVQFAGAVPFSGNYAGRQDAELVLNETTGIVEIYIIRATNNGGNPTADSQNKYIGLQDKLKTTGATSPNCSTSAQNYWNGVTDEITSGNGQAWKFVPAADYAFQWSTAGSNISGAQSTTYTTAPLNTPGTVSYTVAATNPNTQCASTGTVNITVNALPAAPNSAGDVTACNTDGNQTLTVTTSSGVTADWYAASTGGSVLASGTGTLTYSTATAATYYAGARDNTTGCVSATRTGVTLNVNTSPAAPTVTTPVNYCQGSTATALTATATGANTLNWYTAAPSYPAVTGATAVGSAPTPSTSTAGTTNYYVSQSSSSNSCESQLALIAVTVNATPSAPTASNPSPYCQNATASALSATATSGNTLYWYTVPTGGTGSATAPTPSTASAGTTSYYVADRNNTSSCEGSRTTVTVTVNPSITASVSNSASSTSACGGGSITFTATPTNGGTPTYQWYLNGSAVGGETNSTYTLSTPNDADAVYVAMTPSAQTCLVSASATNSNTVTLTSTASTPSVAIQSSAASAVCPGTSVTFNVNTSANMGSSPTYQWNLNGNPISGATNPTLVSTTLANNDQVTLTMTSSLSGGCLTQSSATSAASTASINTATSITTQPAATSVCSGTSANFSVVGAGQGTLTYQWKKNGTNITGNATATTSSLTLSGVGAGDVANYTVDVTGTCGTVASSQAALSLNAVTAISAQPVALTKCTGLDATYSVTASGQGTLSYQWRKDGTAISGATGSSYTATGVTSANAGNYSVIVSGGCGNVTSNNASLTVQPATVISSQPSASTVCQNNTANFAVTATGQGTLSYQWKRDGNNVGTNSSTLAVTNAQSANAGTYTVEITGGCGVTTSNGASILTVNPATSITTQPVGTSGCEGQNTTFTVVAAGTGTLSYQWKYGSTNVGTNSASYNISSTTTANDGNYSVVVSGGCGNATSSTVALNVYPSPTTTATISTADITDATLCGKNSVSVSANSPGAESTGQWSIVGNWGIVASSDTDPSTTFTANNAALGGAPKKLVWSHERVTLGNSCFTRDTITIDFKQPAFTEISTMVQNNDVLWNGLTDVNWSTSSNWYQYSLSNGVGAWIRMTQGEPGATTKVYRLSNANAGGCVSSLNNPTLGNGESAANIYVGNSATLNLSSGSISITGDLVNNGTINPGTGIVTFNGTGNQKITGSGAVANLYNVIVNKTSGTLTLEEPTKIAGTLTMTQGDIVTDATNILEVGTSATSVGSVSWAAGTVRGPMKRWFAASTNSTQASGVFPVGATIPGKGVINRYAQVNFSSAPGAGGYIIAEYKTGTPSTGYTGLPLTYNTNQYIQNFEEEGYWDITPYNSSNVAYGALNTAPYTLKLRMNNPSTLQPGLPPSGSNGNSIATISNLRIITSKGPSHNTWVLAGTQGAGQAVLASGDYLLEETGVTGFSFFNGGGNDNNPLPVELLSFTGACDEGIINLTWQTASEFNSSHFDVEKSRDGENWQLLTTLPSAGMSNELITYQSTDQNGTSGNNYFRLRQVDIDGTEKLYDPINVSCSEVTTGYFSSFPNPSGTSFQVVVNNKELIGTCTLNMVDASGKVIEQRTIDVKEGINLFVINQELNPGIYFLNITNGAKSTQILRHAVK